ncbi:NAD-dependent succinate-semialdehyde dehydrogenase [Devosia sediminis]|uniref:NAD-dependent succinate-semialdehyde dehydrogenase n=1 Tax=Devosia sediminis TaxID=2798801 RepID=A0A934MLP2_9HYPH|nr:NAD-dependent succinate-semialdehyde dehydrogenase [Devosia sediminis]MBJ3785370.1 NAD-dependent succinate-semialdehyde dehydrogenase [Devosia sediminis]
MNAAVLNFPVSNAWQPADKALRIEKAYYDGAWHGGSGPSIAVTNPATGAVIGHVPALGRVETGEAITAAHAGFGTWRKLLPQQRAAVLRRWFELIVDAREDLAIIMTSEQGKPLAEARGEIDYAASFVEWFAEEAKRVDGEIPMSHLPGRSMRVVREPIGVVACVTPWNFPCAMITRKAAAALAAGCSVVVRPASETPFSAIALAVLAERAGFPRGVFNVLTGPSREIVGEMTRNPLVRGLSFTGSTAVGKELARDCAGTLKRVSMELGGHAPFLVFDDVDLDRAVAAAVDAKFQTTGQDCLAANRILVQRSIYDAFLTRFVAATEALRIGNGFDAGVTLGPLMHDRAIQKCLDHITNATSAGARLLTGGEASGLFITPAVLADVRPDMAIFREETFGPVAAVMPFDSEDEAIALANDTEYGLSAYLFTQDHDRICRVSGAIRTGMLAVNCVKMTGHPIPFGGVRDSGLGREGGRHAISEFTDLKYVCAAFRTA